MSEQSPPVLVYDRIDSNRRTTRRLLAAFTLAVIPFASGATVWLLPLIVSPLMMFASSSTAVQESMREMSTKSLVAVEGGILLLSMLLVSVGMALATAFYLSRHGAAMVRRAARAVSCDRSTEL
ncbi:MAG: hypothetical protein JRH17_19070, partial [Deltaproteobacteria bacterium]|nr:hypothetical protein [Deltaproteobacteria bacterium]